MKRPCAAIIIFFLLLSACNTEPGREREDTQFPEEFVKKTPALPATFVDTTGGTYAWMEAYNVVNSIGNRIAPPEGYVRTEMGEDSFARWLRDLPLKPGKPDVMLYDGRKKGFQGAHHAVVDIDVGERDLQQCADAVMRLRAEYLYTGGRPEAISFNFTSGDPCPWSKWKAGYRPKISGNNVSWAKSQSASESYRNFRAYMNMVFNYAGTASLSKELRKVGRTDDVRAGDVFIRGGFPGHAVIVVDVAEHPETGRKAFLLAQSYMPAQDIHVLVNPGDAELSPWYAAGFTGALNTPEWTFSAEDLMRFE